MAVTNCSSTDPNIKDAVAESAAAMAIVLSTQLDTLVDYSES
jgi:hypothetical protein